MQSKWRSASVGISCALLLIGCDQSKQADRPVPATAPTVAIAPKTPETPTDPASTQPANAFMMINQQRFDFPPAKLRLGKVDGHVMATLYSDDPKDALEDKYHGNGFYFELPLDVPETTFDEAVSYHRVSSVAKVDTPYGIFLDGHRMQLQPENVKIAFKTGVDGLKKVEITGTFLPVSAKDNGGNAQEVDVAAWLMTDVVNGK